LSKSRTFVLDLLYTCHEARLAILNTFYLDIEFPSSSPWNYRPWNPQTGTLHLSASRLGTTYLRHLLLTWSTTSRTSPFPGSLSARNIALPLDTYLQSHLKIRERERWFSTALLRRSRALVQNLPALETLGLWLDERNYARKREGRIAPEEPDAHYFCNLRGRFRAPALILRGLKRLKAGVEIGERVPRVEIKIVGWKRGGMECSFDPHLYSKLQATLLLLLVSYEQVKLSPRKVHGSEVQ
jgi:hypothetical protein